MGLAEVDFFMFCCVFHWNQETTSWRRWPATAVARFCTRSHTKRTRAMTFVPCRDFRPRLYIHIYIYISLWGGGHRSLGPPSRPRCVVGERSAQQGASPPTRHVLLCLGCSFNTLIGNLSGGFSCECGQGFAILVRRLEWQPPGAHNY